MPLRFFKPYSDVLFQGLLDSWSEDKDPCTDAWTFVSCNCSDIANPALPSTECAELEGNLTARRVLSLSIPAYLPRGRRISGILSPGLAGLTALRRLQIVGQNFQVLKPLGLSLV